MRYLNKIASAFCAAALGLLAMTSCEGGDLYNVNSPDWLSEKIDSINNAKGSGQEEVLEGMMEDVYTIGATDYSTGWWAAFSKYYQIADGQTWNAQFNLSINPDATNTYKNFALIICNDEDRGAVDYKEYGAIRFDHQPASNGGNSEWGDHIKRDNVTSTLTFQYPRIPCSGGILHQLPGYQCRAYRRLHICTRQGSAFNGVVERTRSGEGWYNTRRGC